MTACRAGNPRAKQRSDLHAERSMAATIPPFPHRHLISVNALSAAEVKEIFARAENHWRRNRKTGKRTDALTGRSIVNLFFEPSTRTLLSFELAGKRLGADVATLPLAESSVKKGESFEDTLYTVDAMQPDAIIVRHREIGAARAASELVSASVVNAGDGVAEHPTQALLDAFTLQQKWGSLEGRRILICGDIAHSRVAGSDIPLLTQLGADVRVAGPDVFLPESTPAETFNDFDAALEGCDAVMMLRIQRERMGENQAPHLEDYVRDWRLDAGRLNRAKPDALIMHPGPMNRDVEITSEVADHPRSVIRAQVESGVAVRMAVLELLMEARA